MSGRELANHLAANHKEMRLLFISGYADDTVLQHDVLGSEVSFMQKPFTPDALARKVRAVLDAGAARASAEPRPKHAPGTAPPPLTFPAARGRE
jgi:FixJ family two-component response regulator